MGIGLLFASYAFWVDYHMRVTSIVEMLAGGSLQVRPGEPAPVHQIRFAVEHPNVPHELFGSPHAPFGFRPTFEAEIRMILKDTRGATLTDREEIFGIRGGRGRPNWSGIRIAFQPAERGEHLLEIIPITVGIPVVHVKLSDAEKRDGRRMPGY